MILTKLHLHLQVASASVRLYYKPCKHLEDRAHGHSVNQSEPNSDLLVLINHCD